MKPILHGLPKHAFFAIAQPPSIAMPTTDALDPGYVKPIFELQDPATKEKFEAELQDVWRFSLSEFEGMNAFSLLVYGLEAKKISKVLQRRYPEIEQKQKVNFLLLKKL